MSYVPLVSKLIGETITLEYNFQSQMRFGETLDPPLIASVAVTLFSGEDPTPSAILTGAVTVSGYKVITKVTAGLGGVIYTIVFHATGSSGAIYRGVRRLAVLSDDSSYAPTSLPSLTGDLPDGVVGAAYSENLTISGGYLPYATATPLPTAPPWMGYTVVGNVLVCAGTPGVDALDSYMFSPRIQDAALSYAVSAQTINLTRTVASGDLADGEVGQSVNYSYTATDGTAPYIFSIIDGELPDGLSMDSAGLVTGTFTSAGSFSWTVRATDVNGIYDDVDDDCAVLSYSFVTIPDTPTPTNVFRSASGTVWGEHIPCGLNTSGGSLLGGGQRLFVFQLATNNGKVSSDGGVSWENTVGLTSVQAKNGLAYSDSAGAWVISLGGGTSVYRSTDGINFSAVSVESRTYYQGACIGNTMIFNSTLGSLIRSTDAGVTWSPAFSNGTGTVEFAVATPTAFIIAGTAGVLRSVTGAAGTWTSVFSSYVVGGLSYGSGRIVIISDTTGASSYSDDDGLTWTPGPVIPNGYLTGGGASGNLTYGNMRFVTAGIDNFGGNLHSAIYSISATGVPTAWSRDFGLISGSQFEWISSAITPEQG